MQPKPADLKKVMHIDDPLRRAFAAKVVGMDESIGRLLATLDELSISENTLVIFMTDHGGDENYGGSNLPLRGGKATLFEGGIRVPCIVRWPAVVAQGSVSDSVACAIDWFATFGQLAGFEVADRDGISILPILRGEQPAGQRTLIWKTGAHAELERRSWAAVRQGNWKWIKPPTEHAMLFDLAQDPNEQTDLADSRPELAEQLAAIAAQD